MSTNFDSSRISGAFSAAIATSEKNAAIMDELRSQALSCLGRKVTQVWVDYSTQSELAQFVLGMIKQCVNTRNSKAPVHKKIGLPPIFIDMYRKHCGVAPFYAADGSLVEGKARNCSKTIEIIKAFCDGYGLSYSDEDFADITDENWSAFVEKKRELLENGDEEESDEDIRQALRESFD